MLTLIVFALLGTTAYLLFVCSTCCFDRDGACDLALLLAPSLELTIRAFWDGVLKYNNGKW